MAKDFPGLGTRLVGLASKINKASQGRINIKVFGSGELVPAYESFDAVRNGVADMCHDSPIIGYLSILRQFFFLPYRLD